MGTAESIEASFQPFFEYTWLGEDVDVNMFSQNIFPKIFEKIAQACYVQQMDSFAKLFEEQSFYNRVMEEMGKAMYFNLKNGQ